MENKENPNPTLRIGIRALIVIIILAILFILSLGIIKLVPKALDGLQSFKDSLSSKNTEETLVVTANPTSVMTGQNVTISWDHTNIQKQDGYDAFKYQCNNAITFSTQSGEVIPCDTEFPLDATTSASQLIDPTASLKSISLMVNAVKDTVISSPVNAMFSIDYINPSTMGVYISRSAQIAVQRSASSVDTHATSTVTVKPSQPTVINQYPTSHPTTPAINNSPADFQVKILSSGHIDAQTSRFIAGPSYSQDEKTAIQFQISNIGGRSTGSWNFRASLPSSDPLQANYVSPLQSSLAPGGSIIFTLGFDPADYSGNYQTATVSLSTGSTDTNQSNNSDSVTLNYNSGSNGSNYGSSDLTIGSAQSGYVDSNGQFVASQSTFAYRNSAAVKLTVINRGTGASGRWSFTSAVQGQNSNYAVYNAGNSYNSGQLASLRANGTQSFIINLSGLSQGSNTVSITLDPTNQTSDINRNNNSATVQVYTNNSYYNY